MINMCTCIRVFPNRWMGEWDVVFLTSRKFAYSSPTGKVPPKANFYSAPSKGASPTTEYQFSCCNLIKTLLLVVFITSVYTIFILTSRSLYRQVIVTSRLLYSEVMLVLTLTDVKYLHNAAFSFEKSSNSRNHSSDSHQSIKNSLSSKISHHAPTPMWRGNFAFYP